MTKHAQPAHRHHAKRPEDEPEPEDEGVPPGAPSEPDQDKPASIYVELPG